MFRDCEEAVRLDPAYVKGYLRAGMALGLLDRPEAPRHRHEISQHVLITASVIKSV